MSERTIRINAYDDGHDRWRMARAAPAAALSGIVDAYATWQETTTSFTTRRELASTGGVFIVNLGAPLEIVDARGRSERFAAGEGFVGGMAEATSLSRSFGTMAGVHVHVSVPQLARLLGVQIADLTDRVVRLDDLGGAFATLGDRLASARDEEGRFTVLDTFLLDRAVSSQADPLETAMALLRRPGPGTVEAAATALGWSRKRLAQRLRDATGLLPRAYVRLARFDRFSAALQAQPGESLAALAADAGYADQAHLTRDVGRLSAMTPAQLRARLLPRAGGVRDD